MNNNINPDEVLSDAELAAFEAKMSVITDVSRSDSDASQLSESERIQAQTFDKLISLADNGISLKPVSFTVPSAPASTSKRRIQLKKAIAALAASVAIVFTALLFLRLTTTPGSNPVADSASTASSSSDNSVSSNYWNDAIDNQLSEFEGEMICLSANYDSIDVAVDSMYNIDDFSDIGEF